MPTYTQIKDLVEASLDGVRTIERSINRTKDLTGGYKAKISFNASNGKMSVSIDGPHQVINRIPPRVIINYAQVLNKVKRWMDDQEPDFPAL